MVQYISDDMTHFTPKLEDRGVETFANYVIVKEETVFWKLTSTVL